MVRLADFSIPEVFNQAEFLTDRHVKEGRGKNTAIYYKDQKITYEEMASMVNRCGNALRAIGVEMENRVLILLPDSPEFIYAYLGAMKIGAIPIPVNTMASPKDYAFFLADSRAKALIISDLLYKKIENVLEGKRHLKHVIVAGEKMPGTLSFGDLMASSSPELKAEETTKDDMAFWMYTSGTTGLPKGVVHLHHDLLYYMVPSCEGVFGMQEEDIVYCTSKLFFSYGRNHSLEAPFMYGASVVLWPEWSKPEEVFDVVDKYRPTIFFSVPTLYNALLRECEKRPVDLSSVRLCISAGEALPKDIFERWSKRFGIEIIDAIGSTDVGGLYFSNREGDVRPGSSGKLLPGFTAELRDEEGMKVPVGEVGTLWLQNDGIANCYWKRHEKNKEVFLGSWFNTGDRFIEDSDGFFYYQGRADDMFKVSGQWTSPIEIENVLMQHPAVNECGVIGFPTGEGLVRVKAFIVLNEGYGAGPEMENELVEFVGGRLAHFKAPKWVSFVKELPRTTTGKLIRYRLRTEQ